MIEEIRKNTETAICALYQNREQEAVRLVAELLQEYQKLIREMLVEWKDERALIFLERLKKTAVRKYDRYEWNDKVSNSIRMTKCCRNLYFAYHYDKKVREAGNEITEFKVDERYAELIYKLQNKMIQKLVREGIGIETNPSSNYLIGTIQKYDEHPILRFNSRKLRDMERNTSLNVSINTDDQGVFDTMLENEYALMALALKKAKDDKHQPLYDVEDIYEWIDYVRKMGIEQVFE